MDTPASISTTRKTTAKAISPFRLFALLLSMLFTAEALIMFTLPRLFPNLAGPLIEFADSLLLITISAPFIWVWIVQPLRTAVKTEAIWSSALLERVVDGVVVYNGDGVITLLNPAAELIFGYSAREMIGQHLNRLLRDHGDGDKILFPSLGAYAPPGEGQRISHDVLGHRKNGTSFPMDFSVSKVLLAGETAFISIIRDTTERKRIETAMLEKQCQLEELNLFLEERVAATVNELREKDRLLFQQNRLAAMGELINNIAHQWRQPLNTLGMNIQRLQLFYNSGDFSKEFLDTSAENAMKQIRYLSQTIADFENVFRLDAEKCTFSVNQTVNQTIDLVRANLTNHRIHLEMNPQGDPHITGYKNDYSQAILSILLNAKDVLIERKIDNPLIKISSFMENDTSVVVISDNGGGIHEDIRDKVFDPYFTTKGPEVGRGIGLFMAKNIIEKNMGGRLSMRNTAEGAEFKVEV